MDHRSKNAKKILILDASRVITQAIKYALSQDGVQVEIERQADSALLKVINWSPDILITGIELGSISGFDLCLILRMMPEFDHMPIILMSSHEEGKVAKRAATIGADYYVLKDSELIENLKQKSNQILLAEKHSIKSDEKRPVKRILVVDDSPVIRSILKRVLRKLGVPTVIEAENGKAGLERLEEGPFDMVISDVNMPVMDGFEFVKNIRRMPAYDQIYVVLITAGGVDNLQQVHEIGAADFLFKPFSTENIRELILKFATLES